MIEDTHYILCVECRGTFSHEELEGATCCPRCGSEGVPADTREFGFAQLTAHEWRILCIWASNWAVKLEERQQRTIAAIIRELHRQMPQISALTLREEFQSLANTVGPVEVHGDGGAEMIEPEKKQ